VWAGEIFLASVVMSPAAKDNEVLTSIPENATARPQPVALEVPVTVNGARAVAGSAKREPFSESTKTVLIFGQGAVVRLSSSVAPGQLLFLTNEKTKKEVVCQVVTSKSYNSMSGYVELEFTEAVSGFWGMRFPAVPQGHHGSETTATSSAAARNLSGASGTNSKATLIPAANQPQTKSPISSSPRAPESVLSGPAVSTNQASTPQSVSTNSLPASHRATPDSPSTLSSAAIPVAPETAKPMKTETAALLVTPKTSVPSSKSILDSDEIKIPSWLEPLARNAAAASAALPETRAPEPSEDFGDIPVLDDLSVTEITDTPEAANRGVPPSSFGTHFLADEQDGLTEEAAMAGKSSKKFLIGALAAVGLLLVGAGGWYVRQSSGNEAANNSATNTATVSSPTADANKSGSSERLQAQPQGRASAPEKPSAKFTAVSTPNIEPDAASVSKSTKFASASRAGLNANKNIATADSATDGTDDVAAPPQPKKQNLGSVKLSAPIVNNHARPVTTEEALNLEPSQPAAGLAPGLVGFASRQPVAPSSAPDIKPASLISSVPPVYPTIAKTQRVSGAVTIDALIDATGHVTSMTVVSGPALLRDSAKDALSRWKYAPAELHGKPVSMHMTVTIQFKLQ
jgi:TonB family protein